MNRGIFFEAGEYAVVFGLFALGFVTVRRYFQKIRKGESKITGRFGVGV